MTNCSVAHQRGKLINWNHRRCFPPTAYTQIQPHSLVQQHKQQQQQQFVALQSQGSQRSTGQLLQTASIQPSQHPVPVLPKPAPHQPSTPSQQATIFHSTISPHALHSSLNHAKAQPVQLTAINLQIQPTVSTAAHTEVSSTSAFHAGFGYVCLGFFFAWTDCDNFRQGFKKSW